MASSVAGVVGWGVSDGETIDATQTRWSTLSRFDVVGGSTALAARGGIMPGNGTPLDVVALGTPAMKVNVKAGQCVIPGNSASVPAFGLTLTTNTDLDIGSSHATLPRVDLVVARVHSDGTSASYGQFEVIAGTAASTPARPTVPNTGNDHAIVLAEIRVDAAVTTIVAGKITKPNSDGIFTAAPGGVVPVRTLADAAGLPVGTPFFDLADNMQGVVYAPVGAGAARPELVPGVLLRYFNGTYTASGGDVSNIAFGHRINGAFVAKPFPNGFLGAVITEATPISALNGPLIAKINGGSVNGLNVRLYDSTGAVTALTSDIVLHGLAFGY